MEVYKTLSTFFAFMLGFLSCIILFYSFSYLNLEKPLNFAGFYSNAGADVPAPADWIKNGQIAVLGDKIIIDIGGASLSRYASTGSMRPILDKGANGIRIKPEKEEDISVGDIVSFRVGDDLVVHRVVEKGVDDDGVYFVTKGDNNEISDGKIRFENIEYVTIGILY